MYGRIPGLDLLPGFFFIFLIFLIFFFFFSFLKHRLEPCWDSSSYLSSSGVEYIKRFSRSENATDKLLIIKIGNKKPANARTQRQCFFTHAMEKYFLSLLFNKHCRLAARLQQYSLRESKKKNPEECSERLLFEMGMGMAGW